MNVLMISPGFPAEMPSFTQGLAEVGVDVLGIGDQPPAALPATARKALKAYLQVPSLWDEEAVVARLHQWLRGAPLHRVECMWEVGMTLAATLREAFGVPGLTREQTLPFRDKEVMKQVLDRHGIRTPRHARARTAAEVRSAAQQVGYPLIVKPIDGAGSADTHRVDDDDGLETVLRLVRHVSEVSVEEFIEGEEYTFDTVCVDGQMAFHNISWYRPKALIARQEHWISPQTMLLRDPDQPELAGGKELGAQVIKALGFQTGFTHMEWFKTPSGEAVFGEIGARAPGAKTVDLMNFSSDIDLFRGWAEATCHGRFSQTIERRYNVAMIFKRAHGEGRIRRIEGLERILAHYGPHVVVVDLLPVGAPRRNWKQTLMSDGYLVVRHPDLATTMEIADRVGTDLQLYAG